ncbi:MAG: ATP cone domain-containing protein [bacterium]
MVEKVIKRDGKKVKYNKRKIFNAIKAVANEIKPIPNEKINELTEEVNSHINDKYNEPHVEQIQDIVEEILMKFNHKMAKAYILYREKHKQDRKHWLKEELPLSIWTKKYQFKGENFEDFFERVSNGNCTIKKMIKRKLFLPAGRILANRGLHKHGIKVTYSNCYVNEPPEDNIESIYNTNKQLARTFSYGGGTGIDISKLRPKGARVNNAAKTTSGAVSFMPLYSKTTEIICQKGRRGALMISIDIDHPDVEEFIDIKNDLNNVTKANISLKVTDDFMEAVKNNDNYKLSFTVEPTGEVIEKEIDANKLFNKIAYSNWNTGEPGMLFWDFINKWNILSEDNNFEYAGVNPCLTGDMKILTKDGYRRFDSFENGEKVKLINVDGNITSGKIIETGIKETVKINLSNNEIIKCTPDHKFMTIKGEECQAKDLKGKTIMPFNNYNRNLNNEYIKLGFIHGDGNLTRLNSQKHNGIEVNIGYKDEDIMILFKNDNYTENTNGREIYVKGYNNILKKLKFDINILPKRKLPKTYHNFTLKQKASFLNGCFSANGSVIKGYRISYKTTCKKFAEQLSNTLKKDFNIKNYITTNKPKKVKFKNGEYKCRESYDVNISRFKSIKEFYLNIGFFQKYKQIQLINLIKEKAPFVRSIKENGKEKVYDFQEPETHWGVVEGYIVHNCAEETLPAGGSCLLGSINLSNIVVNKFKDDAYIDYELLKNLTEQGVIYLNEVLDEGLSFHPLPIQRKTVKNYRQIGLGIMGLADMFIKLGVKYGSDKSLTIANKIGSTIINKALQASAILAKENGTYPAYNHEAIMKSYFININSTSKTRKMINKYGLYNSQLLTIAPTGSISTMLNISGGIEPLYALSYKRKTQTLHDEDKEYEVYPSIVQKYMDLNNITKKENLPEFFVSAKTLNYKDRIKMQATFQKYIDASISSTVNLSNNTTINDIKDLYMYAWEKGVKGITIFRDGCKRTGILSDKGTGNKKEMTENDFIEQGICPECKSNLIKTEGCTNCQNCGYSVCSI